MLQMRRDDLGCQFTLESHATSEGKIEHTTERIQIRAFIHLIAFETFWCHVMHGTLQTSCGTREGSSITQIRDHEAAGCLQNVVRFEIEMQKTTLVNRLESAEQLVNEHFKPSSINRP